MDTSHPELVMRMRNVGCDLQYARGLLFQRTAQPADSAWSMHRWGIFTGVCVTAVLCSVALLLTDWEQEADKARQRAAQEAEENDVLAAELANDNAASESHIDPGENASGMHNQLY